MVEFFTEKEKTERTQLILLRDQAKKTARIAQLKIEAIENASKLRALETPSMSNVSDIDFKK